MRKVQIASGYNSITLPNGITYSEGEQADLTDSEFEAIRPALFTNNVLIDLGLDSSSSAGSALGPLTGSAPVTVISTAESGWTKSSTNGTFVHDATIYKGGAASGKLTLPNDGSAGGARVDLAANQDWSGSSFGIWLRCDNWANVTDGYLKVSTGATTFANWFLAQWRQNMQQLANNEWVWLSFGQGIFGTGGGTPTWTTARSIIIEFYATSGQTPNIWFAGLERSTRPSKAMVSIASDDGYATCYSIMRPKLAANGFRGTFYIIPTRLGTNGFLTQTQVDELADLGHDISGHGDNNLATLSLDAATVEVQTVRNWLAARGYKGQDHYAYPLGGRNQAIERMMRSYWRTARGTSFLPQDIGRPNAMNLMARQPGVANSAAQVQGWIDQAEANHEWLILGYHQISNAESLAEDTTQTKFNTVMDYLATRQAAGGIDVLPVSEAALRA